MIQKWPELIYPFASAIDTDLPQPPETVNIMLDFAANWAEIPKGKKAVHFPRYPKESIEEWHKRHHHFRIACHYFRIEGQRNEKQPAEDYSIIPELGLVDYFKPFREPVYGLEDLIQKTFAAAIDNYKKFCLNPVILTILEKSGDYKKSLSFGEETAYFGLQSYNQLVRMATKEFINKYSQYVDFAIDKLEEVTKFAKEISQLQVFSTEVIGGYIPALRIYEYFHTKDEAINNNRKSAFSKHPFLFDLLLYASPTQLPADLQQHVDQDNSEDLKKSIYNLLGFFPKNHVALPPAYNPYLSLQQIHNLIKLGSLKLEFIPAMNDKKVTPKVEFEITDPVDINLRKERIAFCNVMQACFKTTELFYGRFDRTNSNEYPLFLKNLVLASAKHYGEIRAKLEKQGKPIGNNNAVKGTNRWCSIAEKLPEYFFTDIIQHNDLEDAIEDYTRQIIVPLLINQISEIEHDSKKRNTFNLKKAILELRKDTITHLFANVPIHIIMEFSKVYHAPGTLTRLKKLKDYDNSYWQNLIPQQLIPLSVVEQEGWKIKALTSARELEAESEALEHCVGKSNYAEKCLKNPFHILSIRNQNDEPQSTFEIEICQGQTTNNADDTLVINNQYYFYLKLIQHRGKNNNEPAERDKKALKWLFEEIKRGKITIDFEFLENARIQRERVNSSANLEDQALLINGYNPKDRYKNYFINNAYKKVLPSKTLQNNFEKIPSLLQPMINKKLIIWQGDTGDLCLAAQQKNIEAVQLLISKGANVNQIAENGLTPLTIAVESGSIDLVKFFLSKGASIRCMTNEGISALTIAVQKKYKKITELLIDSWVEIIYLDLLTDKDTLIKYEKSLLSMALSFNTQELLKPLIKPAILQLLNGNASGIEKGLTDIISEDNFYLLHLVGKNNNDLIITFLKNLLEKLDANSDYLISFFDDGNTFLTYVANYGNTEVMAQLLNKISDKTLSVANKNVKIIDVKDRHGNTPLMLAVTRKDVEMVKLLLSHGAEIQEQNLHGATAIKLSQVNQDSTIENLLKCELDIRRGEKQLRNNENDYESFFIKAQQQDPSHFYNYAQNVCSKKNYFDSATLLKFHELNIKIQQTNQEQQSSLNELVVYPQL